jgi:Uma2 family endonuclease
MELNLDVTKRYTYADYLTWLDDKRRELIDGFVHILSAPSILHSEISGNLYEFFKTLSRKREGKYKVFHSPIDVKLFVDDDSTLVQPDVIVVTDLKSIKEKFILGAPALIVEVQSPSTAKYDLTEKFSLYERAGVKEYWVVYPNSGITIFTMQENGKYDDGSTYDLGDVITKSSIVSDLNMSISELFHF